MLILQIVLNFQVDRTRVTEDKRVQISFGK